MVLHGNPEMHTYIAASPDCFPDREQLLAPVDENRSIVSHSEHFFGVLELLVKSKSTTNGDATPDGLSQPDQRIRRQQNGAVSNSLLPRSKRS